MAEDFNQGTDHPFPRGIYTYDPEARIWRRDSPELSLSDDQRTFRFPQGMTIQKIIEEIVLISNYGENATKSPDKEGMITWFKVETECYLLNSPAVESVTGRKPRVFVYNVVPYRVHSGVVTASNKDAAGAESRAQQVSKVYNYIYSGENQDVLSFDIQFRTAFYEAVLSDRANEGDDDRKGGANSRLDTKPLPENGLDSSTGSKAPTYSNRGVNSVGDWIGGGREIDAKKNLARQFHNTLLNSNADLITANVVIWGDPYYLPDSGMGNYTANTSEEKSTMTEDGGMDYQRNEIDILVNFRTPVDYNDAGGMDFHSNTTKTINGFSGFYRVITVETTITGNKFTQSLELIRRRNQSLDGIGGNSIIEKQSSSSFSSDTPGPVANPNAFARNTPGPVANPNALPSRVDATNN